MEECDGVRSLARELSIRVFTFIGETVGTENMTTGFALDIFRRLESLILRLEKPGVLSVEEKADVAGDLFDIMNIFVSLSYDFGKIAGSLEDYESPGLKANRTKQAREALSARSHERMQAIREIARSKGIRIAASEKFLMLIEPDLRARGFKIGLSTLKRDVKKIKKKGQR